MTGKEREREGGKGVRERGKRISKERKPHNVMFFHYIIANVIATVVTITAACSAANGELPPTMVHLLKS